MQTELLFTSELCQVILSTSPPAFDRKTGFLELTKLF